MTTFLWLREKSLTREDGNRPRERFRRPGNEDEAWFCWMN